MSKARGGEKCAAGGGTTPGTHFLRPRAFFIIPPQAVEIFFEKRVFYANQTIYDPRGRQRRGFAGYECFLDRLMPYKRTGLYWHKP